MWVWDAAEPDPARIFECVWKKEQYLIAIKFYDSQRQVQYN